MYEELMRQLRACMDENIPCKEANCGYKPFSKDEDCVDNLMHRAVNTIEELSRVAEAIPHVCECCIGCEVETGGCDRAFVLSPKRAMEYLSNPRWIPVTKAPSLKVGDEGYPGYLVYANGYYDVADYAVDRLGNGPSFHVDGEYEPEITHYMPLPGPPKEETR